MAQQAPETEPVRELTDALGSLTVPAGAYYGAATQRAVENFHFSRLRFSSRFIWAHALVKAEAAQANKELGVLDASVADAITKAADEVAAGDFASQFVLDIFQTGSGTSMNMNVNEVIAARASEILTGDKTIGVVHANDHVNAGQSSNDSIPTSIYLATVAELREELLPALGHLAGTLRDKQEEVGHVVKTGRTHLMDAPPIRFGHELGAYATQIEKSSERVRLVLPQVEELALGGTVVGTGLNAPDGFADRVIERLAERTGYPLFPAADRFEALGAKDGAAMVSGALRTVAVSLFKIANDIRWLHSGPNGGIGEIRLKPLQLGSSIIPGLAKVNAVICEAVMMAVAHVIGNDAAVVWAAANGNLELNVMMPVLAHNLLESVNLLASSARELADKTVRDMTIDEERSRFLLERNVTLVTALTPVVGYDVSARIASESLESGRSVFDVARELTDLDDAELRHLLDPERLTHGGRAATSDSDE